MSTTVKGLLCGGIGSGKSAAGDVFTGLGAAVVSTDDAGRAVLAPGEPAAAAVASQWPAVVSADGVVDRAGLAGIVFRDPAELRRLEEITHPAILARVSRWVDEAAGAPVVMVEVPLPGEWFGLGWVRIVVDAPDDVRFRRLVRRGMTPEEIALRTAVQPTREEWLAYADLVVDNGGGRRRLQRECRRVWAALLAGG